MKTIIKLSVLLAILFQIAFGSALNGKLVEKRQVGCDPRLEYTAVPNTYCTKFYRCDGTRLFVFDCAPGTLFDARARICSNTAQYPCC